MKNKFRNILAIVIAVATILLMVACDIEVILP